MIKNKPSLDKRRSYLLDKWSSASATILLSVWFILLILPAATTFSSWHSWGVSPRYTFVASCWVLIVLRLLMPGSYFFLGTYPIALLSLYCLAADFSRNVDLLDLATQWHTFSRSDISSAVRPYALLLPLGATLVAGLCWLLAVSRPIKKRISIRRGFLFAGAGSAVFLALAPIAVWPRTWPINGLLIMASVVSNSPALANYSTQGLSATPRLPSSSWNASRTRKTAEHETFMLVIGESIRSDFVKECGGPSGVRSIFPGSIVACDVTAGADATHTSVPLLISREMPGHRLRVSDDATFQRAFAEVGFATSWYGAQDQSVGWPDAAITGFPSGPDREALLPLLDRALLNEKSQSIVLHTNGAHAPYCSRFNHALAPFPDECEKLGVEATPENIDRWRAMYANAVDDSIDVLNQIIARLEKRSGQVFLIYTPDHGENLLDDRRVIYGHALRQPTKWDIRVPAVFWANKSWQTAHQEEWQLLKENASAPLMHSDLVPTMLAAAGIEFEDPRDLPVKLIRRPVPNRVRLIQTAIGSNTSWDALVEESK